MSYMKERILIMEDETAIQFCFIWVVDCAGYEVSLASDGLEGIFAFSVTILFAHFVRYYDA